MGNRPNEDSESFGLSKEKWTRAGFEHATSRLMCRHSVTLPTELSSPYNRLHIFFGGISQKPYNL